MCLMTDQRSQPAPSALGTTPEWIAIIPVKSVARAKTRLLDAIPGVPHEQIVLAIAVDTVAAAKSCGSISEVLVVTDDPVVAEQMRAVGARIVQEVSTLPIQSPGFRRLNEAFEQGERAARHTSATCAIIALTGDLPALRPAELMLVLAEAQLHPRAFLADAGGVGTAVLTAGPGQPLDPHFGVDSALTHASSGATALVVAAPSVRRDVDTVADLEVAIGLGLGARTRLLLSGHVGQSDDQSTPR